MFSKLHFSRPFASSTVSPWGFFKEERRVRKIFTQDALLALCVLQFRREEDAEKAVMDLNNRWFNGQPIHAELSPVTDFREACCRQYEMGWGTAGNLMHRLRCPDTHVSSWSTVSQYLNYFRWTLVCAGFGEGSMEECLQQDNPTLSCRVEPAAEQSARGLRVCGALKALGFTLLKLVYAHLIETVKHSMKWLRGSSCLQLHELCLLAFLPQDTGLLPAAWAQWELSHFVVKAVINFVLAQCEETSAPLLYESQWFSIGSQVVCSASDRTNTREINHQTFWRAGVLAWPLPSPTCVTQSLVVVALLHQNTVSASFNSACTAVPQRVHPRGLLQFHAPETHIAGTSKGAVWPPQEKVRTARKPNVCSQESFRSCQWVSLLLSQQAPLSLTFPGTTLPLQGSTTGPRKAEVEGPRALWTLLKEAETAPLSHHIPPSGPQQWWQRYFLFFFLMNCWKCFFFYFLFF